MNYTEAINNIVNETIEADEKYGSNPEAFDMWALIKLPFMFKRIATDYNKSEHQVRNDFDAALYEAC